MRFTAIDDTNRGDHRWLTKDDQCAFLIGYTDRRFNPVTQQHKRIWDLKIKPTENEDWKIRKKKSAIRYFADILSSALSKDWLRAGTIVPVPCSKASDHPDFDRRLVEVCHAIDVGFPIDVRELVSQTVSMDAAHTTEKRPQYRDLIEAYEIEKHLMEPEPTAITIFDDMLTTGNHFKAMKYILRSQFQEIPISGIFLARREIHRPNEED